MYSVNEGENACTITKYACAPLKESGKSENELLQYPCTINVFIESGLGKIYNTETSTTAEYINTIIEYGSEISIPFVPDDGYKISKVTVIYDNDENSKEEITNFESIGTNKGIKLSNVTKNAQVKVSFATV